MTHSRDDKDNSKTHDLINIVAGMTGRLIVADPFFNLAKRSQVSSKALGLKDIPDLLFMQTKNDSVGKKIRAVYSGSGFNYLYRGLQVQTLYYSIDVINKEAQDIFGKNRQADLVSAFTTGCIQTLLLQAPSTMKTRLQANPSFSYWQALVNNPKHRYPWHVPTTQLWAELKRSNLSAGTGANLCRNILFFIPSTVVNNLTLDYFVAHQILGDQEKANTRQKDISKAIAGTSGVFGAILFDNVKTQLQVQNRESSQPRLSLFGMIKHNYQTRGLVHNFRAAVPNSIAEFLSVGGFAFGIFVAEKVRKKMTIEEDSADESHTFKK